MLKMLTKYKILNSSICKPSNKFNISFLTTSNNKITYPYKFGGIQYNFNNKIINNFNELFKDPTRRVEEGFRLQYFQFVSALKNKDKNYLQKNLQKSLTQHMILKDVNLLNDYDPVQVKLDGMFVVLGSQFKRTANNKNITQYKINNETNYRFYTNLNFMNFTKPNLSILICCQVYFKSSYKLVSDESQSNNQSQVHMLQIQTQISLPLSQLMTASQTFATKYQSNNNQNTQKFINQTFQLGKYFNRDHISWKIGDVDQLLNGNFIINKSSTKSNLFKLASNLLTKK